MSAWPFAASEFFSCQGISQRSCRHSPPASPTSFKHPQTVRNSISFQHVLPTPAPADRPALHTRQHGELFHPVRSCSHLFSGSKIQASSCVMIGFLLCNLLKFSPTGPCCATNTCTHTHMLTNLHI